MGPPLCFVVVTILSEAVSVPLLLNQISPDLFLNCIYYLQCKVSRIGALSLGEEPLNIHPLELPPCEGALLCHLSPIVQAHKVHCCWHCPWPHLNRGNARNLSTYFSGIVFTRPPVQINEIRPQDSSSHTPEPTVGAIEAAQTLAWLSPCLYALTKPIAARARSISAVRMLVVC